MKKVMMILFAVSMALAGCGNKKPAANNAGSGSAAGSDSGSGTGSDTGSGAPVDAGAM